MMAAVRRSDAGVSARPRPLLKKTEYERSIVASWPKTQSFEHTLFPAVKHFVSIGQSVQCWPGPQSWSHELRLKLGD